MGFKYLNGKSWLDVTREERLFCSFLYWDIRQSERDFIIWLNNNTDLALQVDANWEIGYEVCFYRDLLKLRDEPISSTDFSPKRTFDLCLFSEDSIVIIEAKVQQMFDESQVRVFLEDKRDIPLIIGKDIDVVVVALGSSIYFDNCKIYGHTSIVDNFDALITWKQMHDLYGKAIYLRANETYKN